MTWWPLAAAALGSATALLIAFVAYPWQKAKDRELQLGQEAREAARSFLTAVQQGYFDIVREGGMRPATNDSLNVSLHNLHFYFEKAEIMVARQYVVEHMKLAQEMRNNPTTEEGEISFAASDEASESFVEMVKQKYNIGKRPQITIVVHPPNEIEKRA